MIAGDEVVQLYFSDRIAGVLRPAKELSGFRKIHLEAGKSKKVTFIFHADQTAFLYKCMKWRVEACEFDLMFGNASDNLLLSATIRISDTKILANSTCSCYSKTKVEDYFVAKFTR